VIRALKLYLAKSTNSLYHQSVFFTRLWLHTSGPNIFLNTTLSNTLNLRSLKVR
jgi:hypothetical protein